MVNEKQGEGKPTLKGGVYRHKETGQELVAVETSKFGNPQADAYVRLGYEFVRPATQDELGLTVDPHAAPAATPMGVKSVAELEVELAEAKRREAAQRETREANEKVAAQTQTEDKKDEVKTNEKGGK